jgi:hypothetical protein
MLSATVTARMSMVGIILYKRLKIKNWAYRLFLFHKKALQYLQGFLFCIFKPNPR